MSREERISGRRAGGPASPAGEWFEAKTKHYTVRAHGSHGVAQAYADFTLLDVTIKTGRTHQIRVHLASAGHAIAGDDKYGDFALNKALARGDAVRGCKFDRMFLHARRLRFEHPASAEVIELEAPLPAECRALLDALPA